VSQKRDRKTVDSIADSRLLMGFSSAASLIAIKNYAMTAGEYL